jgi:hypothetical protein
MRQRVVVLMIALAVAGGGRQASAQTLAAIGSVRPLTRAIDEAITRESSLQMTRYPGPHRSARCCNLKGAAIGAGIGAAIGFGLVAGQCSGSGCAGYAGKAVGILGGIGAGIGLFM